MGEEVILPNDENDMHWSIWLSVGLSVLLFLICIGLLIVVVRRRYASDDEETRHAKRSSVVDKADNDYWANKMRQLDTEARLSSNMPIEFDPNTDAADQGSEHPRRGSV